MLMQNESRPLFLRKYSNPFNPPIKIICNKYYNKCHLTLRNINYLYGT